eukprot:TRINITY_DN56933_c0_g1_i1.p1 TRINITY_DN56933_c0_g1~~TRINITY_DN56933_c0_g1_i1.p1  ORF type:complete len:515 (+),score=79.54 TRINITY_DN56933_c0_g1_i1:110-1546(+)
MEGWVRFKERLAALDSGEARSGDIGEAIVEFLRADLELAARVVRELIPDAMYAPVEAITGDGARHSGSITSFNAKKGYGFIDCQALRQKFGCNAFLRRGRTRGQWSFQLGQTVNFAVLLNKAGKPEAFDLAPGLFAAKADEADRSETSAQLVAAAKSTLQGDTEAKLANGASLAALPAEEREKERARRYAARWQETLQAGGCAMCGKCMLQATHCLCGPLSRLREEASAKRHGGAVVHFVVLMCVEERVRASNTGKLLELVLPGSEVLIHNDPACAKRLEDILALQKHNAFALFPSDGATSACDFFESRREPLPAASSPEATGTSKQSSYVAVLLDGTWRQARKMQKSLPSWLPHVTLTDRGDGVKARSEFHWRRQSEEGRVSTVEAAALLLEDVGEAGSATPGVLRKALAELNAALERQSCYSAASARRSRDLAPQAALPEPSSATGLAVARDNGRVAKLPPGYRSNAAVVPRCPES